MSEYKVGQIVKSGKLGDCNDCPLANHYGVIVNVDNPDCIEAVDDDGDTRIVGNCMELSDKQPSDFPISYYKPGMKVFAINPREIGFPAENGQIVTIENINSVGEAGFLVDGWTYYLNNNHMFPVNPTPEVIKSRYVEYIAVRVGNGHNQVTVSFNQDEEKYVYAPDYTLDDVPLTVINDMFDLIQREVRVTVDVQPFLTRIMLHLDIPHDPAKDMQQETLAFIDQYLTPKGGEN